MRCGALLLLCDSSSRSALPPLRRGSLRRAPVGVVHTREERSVQLRLGEARLDRRARDRAQLRLVPSEALARDRVLAPDRRAEVRRVVGGEGDLDPGVAQRRQRMGLVAGEDAEDDVARRAALEHDAALGELGHERRVLDRPHAVADPGDRQRERAADALGARPLAGVDAAPQPGPGRDRVGLGERPGRVAGLVARHLEADDVGVGALGGVAGDPDRRLDAEVPDAREEDPGLDAVLGAGGVDPRRDPVEVLGVGEADERRVVGGGDELDIDRALGGAGAQVLVRDVAVVRGGADHARGHVVGLQEVEEVAPREAVGRGEDAVGDAQPVALGDPAHEVRRRGALEVDVQLGLGDHAGSARRSRTTGTSGGGGPPTVNASRRAAAARRAAIASRACTTASGRSSGPTRSPGAATSDRPTAGSMLSASWRRPPPSATTTSPTRRTSIAVTKPSRSGRAAAVASTRGRWRSGASSRSAGPPSAATILAKRSAAAPLLSACAGSASRPPSATSSRQSASVTSTSRGSASLPVSTSIASWTSSALPAVRPSTRSMSVMSARHGSAPPRAVSTIAVASSRASPMLSMNAPEPTFTSMTSASRPAASFLDRIEATMSGSDSTVPVASRMAYRRRSAGARSPVWPTIAQPASATTARRRARSGAAT